MSMSAPLIVSAAELGSILALTDRHVRRLRKDGIFPGSGAKYDLRECVPAYVRLLREGGTSTDMQTEKLLTQRAKRRQIEIANDVRMGRLLSADLVEQEFMRSAARYVGGLDALPARVAAVVQAPGLIPAIKAECHAIRAEIAAASERRAEEIDRLADKIEREEKAGGGGVS